MTLCIDQHNHKKKINSFMKKVTLKCIKSIMEVCYFLVLLFFIKKNNIFFILKSGTIFSIGCIHGTHVIPVYQNFNF